MKKVVLGMILAIAVLSLVLLAWSCSADTVSATNPPLAQAQVQLRTNNGIVHPNLLPVSDFRSAEFITFSSVEQAVTFDLPDGLYFSDQWSITNNVVDFNSGGEDALRTRLATSWSKIRFFTYFTYPSYYDPNGTLAFNIGCLSNSPPILNFIVYDLDSASSVRATTTTQYSNSITFSLLFCNLLTYNDSSHFGHRCILYCESGSSTDVIYSNLIPEK